MNARAALGFREPARIAMGSGVTKAFFGATNSTRRKAAARPNSFAHISAIAACSLALAGRLEEARTHLATIRRLVPDYRVANFLSAMHFPPDAERLFRMGAKRIGLE